MSTLLPILLLLLVNRVHVGTQCRCTTRQTQRYWWQPFFLKCTNLDSKMMCISRHTVVCRMAQENGAACAHNVSILTQRTKYDFTHVCSSVVSWPSKTKFAVQGPAYQERTHSRSKVNRASRSWNISLQKVAHFLFLLFAHLQKTAIKCKRIIKFPSNLACIKGI